MLLAGEHRGSEAILPIEDERSGLQAITALHSTVRGPAFGGIRRMVYADRAAALEDALRLAEGMSLKCAALDLPAGGGKTVVLDHAGLRRDEAYRALGRAIAGMEGQYVCGPDVGTAERDLDLVRDHTRWVNPKGNDPAGSTAVGVLAGLRGVLRALGEEPSFEGRRFVVQGLGAVGSRVAQALGGEGGQVVAADPRQDAQERAEEDGIALVGPARALQEPCDVFVPCALGGVLTQDVARALPARAVCGSANNQLAAPAVGETLRRRGIAYAPDFMVNSGAVAEGVLTVQDGATPAVREQARRHIATIEHQVVHVLETADAEGRAPHEVAEEMARARLVRPGGRRD